MAEGNHTMGRGNRAPTADIKWFFQGLSGLFLVFFVAVHLYVAHINGGTPVELFNSVVGNLNDPLWLVFFISFLWVITYHALNGVKGIVYDLGIRPEKRKYVAYAFSGIYILTVIYGTMLAVVVAGMTP